MKRLTLILLSLILFLIPLNAQAIVRNVQDNHRFAFTFEDADGDPITGETITLLIMRASDGYYFDFNDSTFKTSGWTTKTQALSEEATAGQEHYYYTFDPPASETGPEQYSFIIDDASATNGLHMLEVVSYQDIGTGTSTHSASDIWSVGTRSLTILDEDSTTIDLDGSDVGGLTTWSKTGYALSAAGIDSIWDEVITGHATVDTFGKVFDDQIDGLRAYGDANWATGAGSSLTAADIWDYDIAAYTGSKTGTYLKSLYDNQDWNPWDAGTRTLTAGTKDSEIDAILADTETTLPASLTTIQADLDTPNQYKADVSGLGTTANQTTITTHLTDIKGVTFSGSTDSLEALRNRGDAAWITAAGFSTHSASDILNVNISAYSGSGYAGTYIKALYDNQNWDVWDDGARTLTELDEDNTTIDLNATSVLASVSLSQDDFDDIADAVWDELLADHSVSGSMGEYMELFNEYLNGNQESGSWSGIEKLIRQSR